MFICSAVKKVRMGKRVEKAFAKVQSATSQNQDEDPNKPPGKHISVKLCIERLLIRAATVI